MIYFDTATDRGYLNTAFANTITSVKRHMPETATQQVFCVDTGNDYDQNDMRQITEQLAYVRKGDKPISEFYCCRRESLPGVNSNNCIQHGAFMEYARFDDDDIIIFTDADIVMTRPALEDELALCTGLQDNQILVGYNNGPEHSIQKEFDFLMQWNKEAQPKLEALIKWMSCGEHYTPALATMPCLNTGIVVANGATWLRLYHEYMMYWKHFDENIVHPAKQQLLMSIIIHDMLRWKELPQTIHSHGHWGEKPGLYYIDGVGHFDDRQVLFSHKLSGKGPQS